MVTALPEAMEEDNCVQVSLWRINDSCRGRYSNGGGDHGVTAQVRGLDIKERHQLSTRNLIYKMSDTVGA